MGDWISERINPETGQVETKTVKKDEFPARFPCFKCGKQLSNMLEPASVRNQPWDACTFNSYGHYGSTVFDNLDGAQIEINVCDDCLTAGKEAKIIGYWPGHPHREMKTWEGE